MDTHFEIILYIIILNNRMYNVTRKIREQEKWIKKNIYLVENTLLDREQEIYRLCSEHSLVIF